MAQLYDTLLWSYILDPGNRNLSLDKIALRELGYKMQSYEEVTQKKKLNFSEVPVTQASIYSGEDVFITEQIYQFQKEKKVENNWVYNDIEMPLLEVIQDIEKQWVKIKREKLKEIGIRLEQEITNLEKAIIKEAWVEFNISSPKQVWEILFEKLWLPKGKKTKTWYSVSAEVLWELALEFPIAEKIVQFRHYSKVLSTYVKWLLELLDKNDCVHTSYNQAVTSTGRLSSTNPNLQNIPLSDGIAWEIRSAFISRFPDGNIMTFDYSQVEIRLLAIMSGDENLQSAFAENIDIHTNTQNYIGANERKIAKAVNFWVIYWISSFWLSKMINIWIKDAGEYIKKFYESYPKVKKYLENTIELCKTHGYVETLFGRKRNIPGIHDSNKIIQKAAEREAINMPIQWSSADIIKIAMIQAHNFLSKQELKSKLIMQVHDELVFDVYPWEENTIKKEIPNIMENILPNKHVKLKVDMASGKNWKDAK